jgi:uncharacterized membrane protein
MTCAWFRIAWCAVYLLALVAILELWREAGGQTHLDLMAWQWKLFLPLAAASAVVGIAVSSAHSAGGFWNQRSIAWLAALILVALAMAAVTYEAHLHENDTTDTNDSQTTAVLRRNLH